MENESHISLGETIILLALFVQNYFLGKTLRDWLSPVYTGDINMSVRDKELSVIAVWALKRMKCRRGWGRQLVRPSIIYSIVQKRQEENWEQPNGDYLNFPFSDIAICSHSSICTNHSSQFCDLLALVGLNSCSRNQVQFFLVNNLISLLTRGRGEGK